MGSGDEKWEASKKWKLEVGDKSEQVKDELERGK